MKIKVIISDLKKLLIVKHTATTIVQEITVFYDSRNHTHQYYTFLRDLKKILCLVLLKKPNVRHVIIKYCVLNSGLTSYCL